MGADPHVIGMILGDRNQYGGPLHAAPDHDQGERPWYTPDNLWQFKIGTDNSARFDLAVTIQRIVAGLDLSRSWVERSACSKVSLFRSCQPISQVGLMFV